MVLRRGRDGVRRGLGLGLGLGFWLGVGLGLGLGLGPGLGLVELGARAGGELEHLAACGGDMGEM